MSTHQEQNAAIRDQFAKQAESYAALAAGQLGGKQNDTTSILVKAGLLGAEDNVLDVGCGPGRLSLSLARIARQVTGIDLTPEMLAQAKLAQAQQGIANITWQQGDILPLPFAEEIFSLVVTQATFHHLADPGAVLAEMIRVAKPGAGVVVNDMIFDPVKAKAFDEVERLRDPSHLRVLTLDGLRAMGQRAGLSEVTLLRSATPLPVEAVLATSFPAPGDLERVRALYRDDAASGEDRLGLSLREDKGTIFATYPVMTMVWRKAP